MIITDSSIQLSSEHTLIEHHQKRESLHVWGNKQEDADRAESRRSDAPGLLQKQFLKQAANVELSESALKAKPRRSVAEPVPEEHKEIADLNIRILRKMIERLTGKVIDIKTPQAGRQSESVPVDQTGAQGGQPPMPEEPQGFGFEYDYYESHYEYETTSFTGSGIIQTADGREINFNVQLNMSREFMSEQQVNIKGGEALKDPLVMNFNGSSAELTQRDYVFDIDSDGRDDQIAFVGPGSGFLALDKNGDKKINDGSELFGPSTGNGFRELADYDLDGNNWIDENDPIYENLRIWMKNSDGEDQLFSLAEKGVGAIYLNHVESPFSLKGQENILLGQVRNSSVFLGEDGSAGTVQQIDLAV